MTESYAHSGGRGLPSVPCPCCGVRRVPTQGGFIRRHDTPEGVVCPASGWAPSHVAENAEGFRDKVKAKVALARGDYPTPVIDDPSA